MSRRQFQIPNSKFKFQKTKNQKSKTKIKIPNEDRTIDGKWRWWPKDRTIGSHDLGKWRWQVDKSLMITQGTPKDRTIGGKWRWRVDKSHGRIARSEGNGEGGWS